MVIIPDQIGVEQTSQATLLLRSLQLKKDLQTPKLFRSNTYNNINRSQ